MTAHTEHFEVVQERDVVQNRRIGVVGSVGVFVMLLSIAISGLLLKGETHADRAAPRASVAPRQIGIVDQTLIGVDDHGRDMNEAARRELDRYGWADRDAGLAVIPVERAMDLVVERGP